MSVADIVGAVVSIGAMVSVFVGLHAGIRMERPVSGDPS